MIYFITSIEFDAMQLNLERIKKKNFWVKKQQSAITILTPV